MHNILLQINDLLISMNRNLLFKGGSLSGCLLLCWGLIQFTGCNPAATYNNASSDTQAEKISEPANRPVSVSLPVNANEGASAYESLDSYKTMCGGKLVKIGPMVKEIAEMLEAKGFVYLAADTADCSGIFHRVLMNFKRRCPGQEIPGLREYRDTRALARWYHKHNQLVLIPLDSVLAYQDLIKPGAVLFYGYGGKTYNDFTANELFKRGKGINHMGVVVDVDYDETGKIERYYLFHGRNSRYTAGITNFHTRVPTRDTYPPLGNGPQQWVAFSTLTVDLREMRID